MKKQISLAGAAVFALVATAVVGYAQSGMMTAPPAGTGSGSGAMMSDSPQKGGSMMTEDPMQKAKGQELRQAMGSGHKVIFSDLAAARKLAERGPAVLFFAADWCPDCRADLQDINANGARLKDITVIVVDYDKAAELRAMYGVTYQHSYVQIDAGGKTLAAWNGGGVDGIQTHVVRM